MRLAQKEKLPASAGALAFGLPDVLRLHRRLQRFYSREEFKRLPLDWIATTCIDAPLLVFDAFDESTAWVDPWSGRGLLSTIELSDIRLDAIAYRRAAEGEKRAQLAKRIRRRWCALVDRSIGYAWLDVPGAIFTFKDE